MKIPIPAKFCFCVPLRIGLLVIGYLKLVSSSFYLCVAYFGDVEIDACTITVMLILEIIFSIIFIAAGHKKQVELYKIYYYYNIVMFSLYIVTFLMMLAVQIDSQIYDTIGAIPFLDLIVYTDSMYELIIHLICNVLFQAYLLLLLISQVRKLQEPTKIELENYIAPCSEAISV